MKEKVSELSEKADEDEIDVLFTLLTLTLGENGINLKLNVENLHELYVANIHNIEDHNCNNIKMGVEESTALKVYTNMTSHVPWARDVIKHVDNGAGINNDDDKKDLVKY